MNNEIDEFKLMNGGKFTNKERDILIRNKNFFSSNQKYVEAMLQIIDGKSDISIRVLDWFVSNYSKKYNTYYKIKINGKENFFYVNSEYKNQLGGYSKHYFDPFCRKMKMKYTYKGKKTVCFETSIGQVNFFSWAIRNKVIVYVQLHLAEIEKDMKETAKQAKERKLSLSSENNNSASIISDEESDNDEPDPTICSSEKINSIKISPKKKLSSENTNDSKKSQRQQLSKSIYEYGIKKSNMPIKLDFE